MQKEILENKESYLEFNKFEGVNIYFTTRDGGVSKGPFNSNNMAYQVGDEFTNVVVNRVMFSKKIEIELHNFVFANQVHETNVYKVTKEDIGRGSESFEDGIEKTDVLYTYEKGIALACFYADCTPIYFVDDTTGLIGIIHSGWQGTCKNIVDKTIEVLKRDENVDPINLKFVIGPSIKSESFEVKEDVYNLFKGQEYTTEDVIVENINSDGKKSWNIDLIKYTKNSMLKNGVKEENIYISNINTARAKNMFSFRRDNVTGRMIAVIVKNK